MPSRAVASRSPLASRSARLARREDELEVVVSVVPLVADLVHQLAYQADAPAARLDLVQGLILPVDRHRRGVEGTPVVDDRRAHHARVAHEADENLVRAAA